MSVVALSLTRSKAQRVAVSLASDAAPRTGRQASKDVWDDDREASLGQAIAVGLLIALVGLVVFTGAVGLVYRLIDWLGGAGDCSFSIPVVAACVAPVLRRAA